MSHTSLFKYGNTGVGIHVHEWCHNRIASNILFANAKVPFLFKCNPLEFKWFAFEIVSVFMKLKLYKEHKLIKIFVYLGTFLV